MNATIDPAIAHAEALWTARYHIEVIAGVAHEKPMPKRLRAIIQMRILQFLAEQYAGTIYEVLPAMDVLVGDGDWLVPDIVVAKREARYEHDMLFDPALLAIEIMSPGQVASSMFSKCERLHQAGCPQCWVLWPSARKAWHYGRGEAPQEVMEFLIPTVTGGLLSTAFLFRDLPDQEMT